MNSTPPCCTLPRRRAGRAAGCILGTALLLAATGVAPAAAADLVVQGCSELLSGEVGVREAVGNVGDFVEVPVTIHTMSAVDAFGLEVLIPAGLLTYVRTDPGDLTSGFELFGGNRFTGPDRVRVVAGGSTAIAAGTVGRLAVLVFQIAAPGSSAFATVTEGFTDDLVGYVSCEDVHGTTRIPPVEWGQVKALYRDR